MDLQCNCEKQELQDFSFLKQIVICNVSTISVNVRVLLKRHFQARIKHSYSPFGCKYFLEAYSKIFTKSQNFIQSTMINKTLIMHNTGGSHLRQIFWEHENLSGLSNYYYNKFNYTKKFNKKNSG